FPALIAARELPLTFTYDRDRGVTPVPLEARPPASPVADCAWQRRLGDVRLDLGDRAAARAAYARAVAEASCLGAADAADAAAARTGLGDRAAAVEAYARVNTPHARTNRGLALLALGRASEAQDDLTASLAADPHQPEARL